MKTSWFVAALTVLSIARLEGQVLQNPATNAAPRVRREMLGRQATGPNLTFAPLKTNDAGGVYWLTNRASVREADSNRIELVPGGAIVQRGPFAVRFAADLNTQGAIELTFNGRRLRSTPAALSYWDAATGLSVLLAQVKDSVGELVAPDRIIYRDAFQGAGVTADVLYTARPGSFHQDIVIRSRQLPAPEAFGLSSATTRVLAMTEFYEAVEPVVLPRLVNAETKGLSSPATAGLLTDQTLVFGPLRMVTGKAFRLDRSAGHVPVIKSWQVISGRTFLIESAPYRLLKAQLDALPRGSAALPRKAGATAQVAQSLREILPAKRAARTSPTTIELARATVNDALGVVLDYVLINGQVQYLINVDFGAGLESEKSGWAAIGKSDSDFWNYYSRDDGQGGYLYGGELTNLLVSMGIETPVKLTVANAPGAWGNDHSDPMFDGYLYPFDNGNISMTLTNLPAGYYDFYLYGHGPADDNNSEFHLAVGTNQVGTQATTTGSGWSSETWSAGQQFVVFTNVAVGADDLVAITVAPDAVSYAHINGMQIASTPAIDPPAVSVIATNDATQGVVTLQHAAADDFYSMVFSNTHANPVTMLVTNSYADSIIARQTNHNRSASEGINITALPALTISPNGAYFNYPSNITITLGFENITNMIADFYRTEQERSPDADGWAYWVSYAQDLRNTGATDEEIRTTILNIYRTSWEYEYHHPEPADVYATNNTLAIQYSTNNGASWVSYSGPFQIAGNFTLQARASKNPTADNRTHYAYLSSHASAEFTHIPASWLAQYFGSGWLTDPDAAPDADPDGDGVTNYLEFRQGRNPRSGIVADSGDQTKLRVYTPLK